MAAKAIGTHAPHSNTPASGKMSSEKGGMKKSNSRYFGQPGFRSWDGPSEKIAEILNISVAESPYGYMPKEFAAKMYSLTPDRQKEVNMILNAAGYREFTMKEKALKSNFPIMGDPEAKDTDALTGRIMTELRLCLGYVPKRFRGIRNGWAMRNADRDTRERVNRLLVDSGYKPYYIKEE